MTLMTLDRLRVERGGCPVVDDVSLTIGPGEFVGLIGPNGAGKTTLMRAALGLERHRGRSSLAVMRPAARARAAAFLPQARQISWPVTVETLVALGRLPHGGQGGPAVDAALARMGLEGFRHRIATRLSGGEQARVLVARALAQEAPLVIADEPLAGLDPAHQIAGMEVFAGLAAEGRGALMALHDLGLAARFCTRLVLMHQGRLVADGTPDAVLTEANLALVFRIRAFRADSSDGAILQPVAVLEGTR